MRIYEVVFGSFVKMCCKVVQAETTWSSIASLQGAQLFMR